MANTSIFEKTMTALQEAKKPAKSTAKAKIVKENQRRTAKSRRVVKENEELEDELDMIDDIADEVSDEVVVVVDPELDSEDYEEAIEDAQEIIDGTPEGEQPVDEEYADDFVYTCPICGNTFFSENEMSEGDACPVCGDDPEAYVLVGEIESPAEAEVEEVEDELEVIDVEDDLEELEADVEDVIEEDLDEVTDEEKKALDQTASDEGSAEYDSLSEKRNTQYKLDEKSFNPFLTKFIKENYKNAKAFTVKEAFLGAKGKLRLECKVFFKSGKSRKVNLHLEGFNAKKVSQKLPAKDDGFFKVEKRNGVIVAPFVFEGILRSNVLRCTGVNYNFITKKSKNENVEISGKLMFKENRAKARRTKRSK